MRRSLSVAALLASLACGPVAPHQDSSDSGPPGTTTGAPGDTTGTSTAGAPTTAAPTTGTTHDPGHTSSHCRGLDIPCDFSCTSDSQCGLGNICVSQVCTPAPVLPTCDALSLEMESTDLAQPAGALALVDLDADGDLDLVVVEPATAQIEILRNDGAGAFVIAEVAALGVPFERAALAAGDLDEDGDFDLAIARTDLHDVLVLFAADGAWTSGPTLSGPAAEQLFIADFDGFGDLDLVAVSHTEPTVTRWAGDGGGGFPLQQDMEISLRPLASLRDLEPDGRADLVGPAGPAVSFCHGQKAGWFEEFGVIAGGDFDILHRQAIVGQLDATPELELVDLAEDEDGPLVAVWRPSADNPPYWSVFNNGHRPGTSTTVAHLADITGDGLPDLVAATAGPALLVLPGDGAGRFLCQTLVPVPSVVAPASFTVGDVDGDARPEVIAAPVDTSELWIFRAPG